MTLKDILGLKGITDGLLVTEDGYVGLLEVKPINFELRSDMEKEAVLEKYEALAKRVGAPFLVTTVARRADPKAHTARISRLMATEGNGNVRRLMKEYVSFMEESSYKKAMSKRFIVAIGKSGEGLTKEAALEWIEGKLHAFQSAVSECGNECVGLRGMSLKERSRFAAEITRELLSPKNV